MLKGSSNAESTLICERSKLIVKNEQEVLEKYCERRFERESKPKSCSQCISHSHIAVRDVPYYITENKYKTVT